MTTHNKSESRIMKMCADFMIVTDLDFPEMPAPAEDDPVGYLAENFNQQNPHPIHEMYSSYSSEYFHDDPTRWHARATYIDVDDGEVEGELCKPLSYGVVSMTTTTDSN